ncbi:hypothetical protein [Micromonospora avicenniae]|uniref:hypothetical protein n=1 Tax=Micromonospora avicenniae TaxID=1198245 RepID=UPI0034457D69
MTKRFTRAIAATLAVAAASLGVMLGSAAPASAGTLDSYTITKTSNTVNGGCTVKATVTYYPGSDTAHFQTTVTSPYWFAACRVNTNLYVKGRSTQWNSAVHFAMACAVTDPSCASTQTWVGDYYGRTPSLTAYVDSVNDGLEAAGLPRDYTRKKAVEGIDIAFTNAS